MDHRCSGRRGLPGAGLVEGAVELADGLAEALLVFDEGDADESFAALAEGPAWGEGDFGVVEEAQGEVDGGLAGEMIGGDLGPDEHGAAGRLDLPADPTQAVADDVAAGLVGAGLAADMVVAHLKGESGRGLRGRKPPDLPPDTPWDPPLSQIKARK